MITGREPNILRCLAPEVRAKELAAQRKAEERHCSTVEKTEQALFTKFLKELRRQGKLYFLNPRSDKASTIEVGHPDYTIWIKNYPVTVFVEMKVPGGELSRDQVNVIGEIEQLGNHVHCYVAWNHLQAENIIQFYLSVLATKGQHDDRTTAGQAASKEGTQGVAQQRDVQATIAIGFTANDVARTLRQNSLNGNLP